MGVRHEKGVELAELRRHEINTKAGFDAKLAEIDAEITRLAMAAYLPHLPLCR